MNARGAHFFIGLFVVAGVVSIFAAGLWLAGADRSEETILYEIRFEGSVSGLSVGSRVSYRGIRIGSVNRDRDQGRQPANRADIYQRFPAVRPAYR